MSNVETSSDPGGGHRVLASVIHQFHEQKRMAEQAAGQLSFEQLKHPLDENTNSIAVIMKHVAGNALSRWTDFLTSDGEKPWRRRDTEFIDDFTSRDELTAYWERGWGCLFDTLGTLTDDDLFKKVTIRGRQHTVIQAILRQIDHYGYHVGQIVLTARILAKNEWETLTIPRGQSEEYNRRVWKE